VSQPTLTGDWGGWRDPFAEHGLTSELVYTADVFSTVHGGRRRHTRYLDNFDLTATYVPPLGGLDLGTFFVYGLANHGGDPSTDAGDAQGVDNIAAPDSIKLYEAWWERAFFADDVSLLVGLYDLNSEFDVIEGASAFINSSFGIGPELSQSGVNGASNFPFTSLGARVKTSPIEQLALQMVVLDGVPGDPADDLGTQIILDQDDGVLVVAEADFFLYGQGFQDNASTTRARRRRVGRGWGELPYVLKLAVGTWAHSKNLDRVDRSRADGTPIDEQAHPGVYVLGDWDAISEDPRSLQGLSVFARLGLADADVQQFDAYCGGGLVYTGLVRNRDEDRVGLGVAAAHNGKPYRRGAAAAGERTEPWEVTIEATYRAQLTGWLALQPDVQFVIDPSGVPHDGDSLVVGVRSEISF
jgi:porin